jgi:hypothetical protein
MVAAGCGPGGPPLAYVEGTVTVDGKPVPNALMTFIPTGGTTSYGKTDKDGRYMLMFTDRKRGAMIGAHKVEIEVRRYSKDEIVEMQAAGEDVSDTFVEIPKKYRADGALTAEVKKGSNKIDFKLDSK